MLQNDHSRDWWRIAKKLRLYASFVWMNTKVQQKFKEIFIHGTESTKLHQAERWSRTGIKRFWGQDPAKQLVASEHRLLTEVLAKSKTVAKKRSYIFWYISVCCSLYFKNAGMTCYHTNIIHQLKLPDIVKRHEFAQTILDKIKENSNFVKLVLISDDAVFHLDGVAKAHNASHWFVNDLHWLIEKSLDSPKTMV